MKEIFSMWKYNTMVALTVLCAGIYMLFLLPFKSIPIIPGFTEIRPASLFPVIFGIIFGPAGAWGSAIGNLAADLFGTFSAGSLFGFVANFVYAYLPYKLWGKINFNRSLDKTPTINTAWKLVEFGIISIAASISCSVIIGWGLNILKLVQFSSISIIIAFNNIVMNLLLGPIFLSVLYRLTKKSRLLWTEIMHESDISNHKKNRVNISMVFAGSIGGLVIGLLLSSLFEGLYVSVGLLPFLIILFYGITNL